MKQGPSKEVKTGRKAEPNSKGVGVGAVSRIGMQTVYAKPATPMYQGRGIKAPMVSQATHKAGSQKKKS